MAVSKAILTAADITARIERLEGFGQEFVGAAIVARAWVDDAYCARLLDDGITAAAELGAYTGGFPARGGIAGLHTLNMWVFRSLATTCGGMATALLVLNPDPCSVAWRHPLQA